MNVNNSLDMYAKGMIKSIQTNSPAARTYIKRFFNTANTENAQGRALIAYHTNLNELRGTDGFERIPKAIEKEVNEVPELGKEAHRFMRTLTQTYPKTLDTRVSLASLGAVVSDKVEPKSRMKKFMVFLNQLIKED